MVDAAFACALCHSVCVFVHVCMCKCCCPSFGQTTKLQKQKKYLPSSRTVAAASLLFDAAVWLYAAALHKLSDSHSHSCLTPSLEHYSWLSSTDLRLLCAFNFQFARCTELHLKATSQSPSQSLLLLLPLLLKFKFKAQLCTVCCLLLSLSNAINICKL